MKKTGKAAKAREPKKPATRKGRTAKAGKKAAQAKAAPKPGRAPWKPICRYCGSKDLAPSFVARHDARCRKCFKERYGAGARKKTRTKK